MARIEFNDGSDYMKKLEQLAAASKYEICGGAIYAGAAVVADSIRDELNRIPTDETTGTTSDPARGPKQIQKEGLARSLGISKMRDDGTGRLDVKVGFDGYNRVKTQKWPNGQPNQMVARSVNSGTSWMKKNPFVSKGTRKAKKPALEAMSKHVDESIQKIMK